MTTKMTMMIVMADIVTRNMSLLFRPAAESTFPGRVDKFLVDEDTDSGTSMPLTISVDCVLPTKPAHPWCYQHTCGVCYQHTNSSQQWCFTSQNDVA